MNSNRDIFRLLAYTFCMFFIIFICVIDYGRLSSDIVQQINVKVESVSGTVISVTEVGMFEHSPILRGKGTRIFKFKYSVNGEKMTGYVRTGMFKRWSLGYRE